MNARLILGLGYSIAALLTATSCNSDGLAGGSGTQAGNSCNAGQTQCAGNQFQTCGGDGTFQTSLTCSSSGVCDNRLGCVACAPGSNTCDDSGLAIHICNPDGTIGAATTPCPFGQTCSGGACIDSCELAASEYVYLVDANNILLSYTPRYDTDPNSLVKIGTLACSKTSTPNSMGVDRKARAWVGYQDGNIYWASPADASCQPSGYTPLQSGFKTFGMGFVSDAPGSKSETLYVGALSGGMGWAKINPTTLLLTPFAPFPAPISGPELSGTGAANLFAYFPSVTAGQHIIAQVNKTTGAFDVTWQLPPLTSGPTAWAFAHWGGRYYQFVTSGGVSQIHRYDPATQQNVLVLDKLPYTIVGAGVSTCAPTVSG